MTVFANAAFQGGHAALDGTELVLSVWGSAIAGTSEPQTLADLTAAGTESTGTLYARATFTVAWDAEALRLRVDAADQWPELDLAGDNDVRVLVVSTDGATDADRDVVAMEVLPTAVTGYDGWLYQPVNGIVGYYDATDVDTRLDTLEARTVAGVDPVDGNYGAGALRLALGVADPGVASTWGVGDGGSAYVDRGRVWLDGEVTTTGGSNAVGTLPAGKRPGATVKIPTTFTNDAAGTPSSTPGVLEVTSAGVITITSTVSLTGNVVVPLAGLSFLVAA